MKFSLRGVLIIIVIICLTLGGYLFYKNNFLKTETDSPPPEETGPVASVEVAPVKTQSITAFDTVFGDVVPAPDAVQVASLPYEIKVGRVMVSAGQKVSKGEPLLEVEPSPDTLLQLGQAKNSYGISKQDLAHVKQLFALKLATNTQILKARDDFQKASLQLQNLKKMGVDGKLVIRAGVNGLVSYVNVQDGAIVSDGKPLVGIISQDRLEVRLGVEPNDAERLVSGQSVWLSPVNESAQKKVAGRVRKISRAVNPATRLVDVFVALPKSARFLLGEYIMGRINAASAYGMTVPRSAVLPEGGNYLLYTAGNGRAVKHIVQTGVESGDRVQVFGGGLKPGDEVVVTGNYELKPGMAVKVLRTR